MAMDNDKFKTRGGKILEDSANSLTRKIIFGGEENTK